MHIEYCIDNTFMVRTPVLNLEVLEEISAGKTLTDLLRSYYSRDILREALFLASPQLYRKAMEWLKHNEQNKKLETALLKYLIRMSSRCTPFGMFAGISSGTFGDKTNITPSSSKKHELHIRYDYQIICKLIEKLAIDCRISKGLKFYANSSLYRIGDEYRYVEYSNGNDGIRHYKLQSTTKTQELESVLHLACKGASVSELTNILLDEGVDKNEANQYINALIDNQVLVSGIEPMVNGSTSTGWLSSSLKSINGFSNKLIKMLNTIDSTHFYKHNERISMYDDVIRDLGSIEFPYQENAVFQADLKTGMCSSELDSKIKKELLELMPVLMKLSRPGNNPLIDMFKERFIRRFEEREVPLMLALDEEAGPGYAYSESLPGDSDLLNGIRLPGRPDIKRKLVFSMIDDYLFRRLTDALALGSYEVEIDPDEIIGLPDPEHHFPATMTIMAKIMDQTDKNYRIQIISAGGVSALNLAGRFCHMDEDLENAVRRMAQKEKELAGEYLLAEILHLPQQRTGNILYRPAFYDYEIPFLARSGKSPDLHIPVSDLMVSIKNDKVMVRSKRLDKYIVPRLSNAHNFAHGSLALYHFLCDLQSQDISTSLGFNWGPLELETTFLPRVRYQNIILSPACWNLQKRQFDLFLGPYQADNKYKGMIKLRDAYKIPEQVLLCDADNELWLDLENPDCLDLLIQELHSKEKIQLKEYFGGSIVRGKHGKYANEFVFFLHRKQ